MHRILINNIIRQLHEIQDGSLWFDQFFKDKLEKLSGIDAFKRPIPELHSVAEHISHIVEWRKECLLRFQGKRRELMNSPDDWKDNQELEKIGWDNLKQLFYESTVLLISALSNKDDGYLDTTIPDTEYTFHYLIEGIIQHDLYHLGQINITIKMIRKPHQ